MDIEEYVKLAVKLALCTPTEAVSITDVEETLNTAMDDFCKKYEQLTDKDGIDSPAELELRASLATILQCITLKHLEKGGKKDARCNEVYNPVDFNGN